MATNKKKTTPKADPTTQMKTEKEKDFSVKQVVKDERTHKISGFLLVLVAVLLFLALLSYCFTWKEDQDKVFKAGTNFLFAENLHVDNMLGRLGAWVSHTLVFGGFGLAAFLLCTLPFVWGANLIFGKKIFSIPRNLFYVITATVYFSIVFAFLTKGSDFSFGGAVGEMCSEYLVRLLGTAGTALLLLVLGGAYAIWRFNPQFKWPEKAIKQSEIPDDSDLPEARLDVKDNTSKKPVTTIIPDEEAALTINSNGKSINELYASGQSKLAQNSLLNDPNPLENQNVAGGGNALAEDEENISVILPKTQPQLDPMTAFNLSEEVVPKEKKAVVPVPFEIKLPAQIEETPEDVAEEESEISVIMPEEEIEEEAEETIFEPPVKDKKSSGSDLELVIKPSAETSEPEEEEEDDFTAKKTKDLPPYDPVLDLRDYKFPSLELLELHGSEKIVTDPGELEDNKNQIINTLKNYDISIQRISATVGPTVTLYEIVPAPGVRISRIKNLEDDIALSLAALGIRIIAPIPGKGTIGIEVPNVRKSIVSMRTLLSGDKFINSPFSLPIAIGKKIDNEHFIVDLASMPHLLMAGATGQGKSVGINAILVSLLYKKHPSQLKLVLVDPKKVELSIYRVIEKHFLAKLPGEDEAIITDTKKVVHTLNALCIEMDNRYDLLKEASVRNIREYNEKFSRRKLNPQKGHQYLPFIVLVVDEFADLIMTAGKEVEMPIARLAQLARAVGIHLIIATQRPSVNIITGTIKANFPGRMAFKVSSKIDSRTILDAGGAEQLIGKGDMLISHNGELIRVQCAFVDTPEVERVVDFIGEQHGYPDAFLLPEYVDEKDMEAKEFDLSDRDKFFEEAARLIVQNQVGSTSLIQRRMKLGYNRAGRLMDQLEAAGIVGANQGSKAREVLVRSEMELAEILDRI
ncbi:MAG: DNA translocase FtsK 4TM domain-containing protein [Bacteroidota bacterium]